VYPWIWQHLPGPTGVKAVLAAVLVALVVLLLFTVVFPWAVTWLPGQDVVVDGSG
jgi:hypothetical protein